MEAEVAFDEEEEVPDDTTGDTGLWVRRRVATLRWLLERGEKGARVMMRK